MDAQEAWSKIAGNAILKRAIEISLLGEHMVTVTGHPDNGFMYAREILGGRVYSLPECPCGNFGDLTNTCNCRTREIQRYRNDMYQLEVMTKAEIFVETQTPRWSDYERSWESFGQVMRRIKLANYPESMKICSNGQVLIDKAIQAFGLRMRQVHNVLSVAHTISALACAESIAVEHVAEAIQYQRPWGNF